MLRTTPRLGMAVLFLISAGVSACCDKPASTTPGTTPGATVAGKEEAPVKPAETPAAAPGRADKVVVYYFHGTRRCKTCLGIQNTIEQTIKDRFGAETASGKLVYREIDTDQEPNKPFVQQFQLSFSTMIVAAMKGDTILQWENCDKVWDYGLEPIQLTEYTDERIHAYLAKLEVK